MVRKNLNVFELRDINFVQNTNKLKITLAPLSYCENFCCFVLIEHSIFDTRSCFFFYDQFVLWKLIVKQFLTYYDHFQKQMLIILLSTNFWHSSASFPNGWNYFNQITRTNWIEIQVSANILKRISKKRDKGPAFFFWYFYSFINRKGRNI